MKTFLGIFGLLQVISLVWWLYEMFIYKYRFDTKGTGFRENIKSHGKPTLIIGFVFSLIFAFFATINIRIFEVFITL